MSTTPPSSENSSPDENLEQEVDEQNFDEEPDFVDGDGQSIDVKQRVKKASSAISGRMYRKRQLIRIDSLRPSLAERIQRDFPDLPPNAKISYGELARYQMLYVEELLQQEHGEFSELDRQVAESIANQETIAENTEEEYDEQRTVGRASFGSPRELWRQLGVSDFLFCRPRDLDGLQRRQGRRVGFRPLPLHFAQSRAVVHCGDPGAGHHDEPEAAGRKRPGALLQRLSRQPQGGTRNPPSPRKNRLFDLQAMATPVGNPASANRNDAPERPAQEGQAAQGDR